MKNIQVADKENCEYKGAYCMCWYIECDNIGIRCELFKKERLEKEVDGRLKRSEACKEQFGPDGVFIGGQAND